MAQVVSITFVIEGAGRAIANDLMHLETQVNAVLASPPLGFEVLP
jgi:hypothetical protein